MTKEQWEALAGLVKPKSKIGEFLQLLQKGEGDDLSYMTFEEGFPHFQTAFAERSNGRYAYGESERSQAINKYLVDTFKLNGVDVKGAKTEDVISMMVEGLKESLKPTPLTFDQIIAREDVQKAINDARKSNELTMETAKAHPIVRELMQGSFKEAESASKTLIENLQSEIRERDEREMDNALDGAIMEWVTRNKIDLGVAEEDKKGIKNALWMLKLAAKNKAHGFKKDNEDNLLPLDSKGSWLAHESTGFPVSFDDFMASFSTFKPHKHDPNLNSPTPKPNGQQHIRSQQPTVYQFGNMDANQVNAKYGDLLAAGKIDEANKLMDAYDEWENSRAKAN